MHAGCVSDLASELPLNGSDPMSSLSRAVQAASEPPVPDLATLCQLVHLAIFIAAHSMQARWLLPSMSANAANEPRSEPAAWISRRGCEV